MFYRFATEVPLRWVDVDSAGVVNNAVYLSLTEQARFAYFTHLGLMADHQVPFVLAEATLQFVKPGRLAMAIQVAACTSKLGRTSFHMNYEVRTGEEVLCRVKAVLVFVDRDLQPCALPDEFRTTVAQFEEMTD